MNSPRYFESFFNADPMLELAEIAARERGTYVVEDDGQMRRYRGISDNQLDSLIYAGWDDPTQPLADLSHIAAGVPAYIHSSVELCSHGGKRWHTWHVSPAGRVEKIIEREYDADGYIQRQNLRSPDGELVSYTIYNYGRNHVLLELITHAPDGTVTSRQEGR